MIGIAYRMIVMIMQIISRPIHRIVVIFISMSIMIIIVPLIRGRSAGRLHTGSLGHIMVMLRMIRVLGNSHSGQQHTENEHRKSDSDGKWISACLFHREHSSKRFRIGNLRQTILCCPSSAV